MKLIISNCLTTVGFRRRVYHLASKHSVLTHDFDNFIQTVDDCMVITASFNIELCGGHFIADICDLCDFGQAKVDKVERFRCAIHEDARYVNITDYDAGKTTSPPGSRESNQSDSCAKSIASEVSNLTGHVTQYDSKDVHAILQGFEVPNDSIQVDGAHIKSRKACKGTDYETHLSNQFMMTPNMHRAFDGTSSKHKPMFKIVHLDSDPDGVVIEGLTHYVYRVRVKFEFVSREKYTAALGMFQWKDGCSYDDEEGTICSSVYVENYEMLEKALEWKCKNTEEIWQGIKKVGEI